jgi:outer membrane protein OmpA-like peptidoglycan-associated protein/uncharacterized protein YdeI (BOF family)
MNIQKPMTSYLSALALGGLVAVAPAVLAQNTSSTDSSQTGSTTSSQASTTSTTATNTKARTVTGGQKVKIKGVVTQRSADTFTVRDSNGVDTVVRLTDRTSVKTKGSFLHGGTNYGVTNILRGLNLEVEGRGDSSGQLEADKIRFNDSDLRVAQSIESRVDPVENRVGTAENRISQVESNAQKLSGQIDELAAVSNAAKGGAKAAQDTADQAVAGVNATNERISALDDYVPQETAKVNFRVNSAVLSPEAKTQLDTLATKALNTKGYVLEVSGYTDSSGGNELNRRLSQKRADNVIHYLVDNHNVPLRRIVTPYGYGKAQPVADNATKQGRAENRRVEVKLLVNKGMTQQAPAMTTPSSGAGTTTNPE